MKKAVWLPILITILLIAAGCGLTFQEMSAELKAGMGKMTYAEAKEKWGEPTEERETQDGLLATWIMPRSAGLIQEELYLTFDKQNQKLRAYRLVSGPPE